VTYQIEFARKVEKQLKTIPLSIREKIFDRIEALKKNPRPASCEKLQGSETDLFRIRQGDYRIVYTIEDKKLAILVVRVVHRKEVYKKKHSGEL
jgi:mRNA interferase RelE/StbE